MKNPFKNSNGFTLVELLVSTAIIATMSALVVANFRKGGKEGTLRMAAQKLASDIRMMQGNSLGLKSIAGTYPKGGWGWRGNENESNFYYLFADFDGNKRYSIGNVPEELSQKIVLPPGVTIKSLEADGLDRKYLYAVFLPPDPKVEISLANSSESSSVLVSTDNKKATITLTDTSGKTIKVTVNIFGLVDVE